MIGDDVYVFPAYAGVIPELDNLVNVANSISRIRGGDPRGVLRIQLATWSFPHTRG